MTKTKMNEADSISHSGHRLLAVHAHPDDECVSTGGILAKYSGGKDRTALVYGTRGEAGDILNPDFAPPSPGMAMQEIRALELAKALKVLRVDSVYFLGYRDSGMAGTPDNDRPEAFARADIEEATARLVDIVRSVRPQVMITYNEKGTYGHPDHIMANRVTRRAFRVAGDPEFKGEKGLAPWRPAKLYYTALPLERLRRMYRLAQERGEAPGLDPEFIGTPEDTITTRIDVRDYLSQKLEALNCHQSQMNPRSFFRRLPEEWREEVLGYEHFVCVQGCNQTGAKETDLFEGLA